MGEQLRHFPRKPVSKGVIASMMPGGRTAPIVQSVQVPAEPSAQLALRKLATLYAQTAERLFERIYDSPHDLRAARAISRHLEWVGGREQLLRGFITAGDDAMSYICATGDGRRRLVGLVDLASQKLAEPGGLSVVLHLLERIDEELRLI